MRPFFALVQLMAVLLLAACTSRPEVGYLSPLGYTIPTSTEHSILVATTRQRDARPGTYFNGERAGHINYAEIDVAVPENHVSGEIELPSKAPGNPKTDFVVQEAAYLEGEQEFLSRLNAELSKHPRGSRKVLLFIHGYNTMFAEGLYRFTQVVHDSKATAVPVLFTWASRGKVAQYVYDTNSATSARDDLDRTIRLIFASDADQVSILAHSMGNWVTVEALRQIKLSGRPPPIEKLGAVLLAAPDIDIDVFKSQMRSIGNPEKPFYIILSKDDKALRASNFIAGGQARLGANENTAELANLGAVVIDMTDVKANDSANHGKFAELAELGPGLSNVLAGGIGDGPSSPSETQGSVGGAIGAIVISPIKLLGGSVRIIRNGR
jgi:esterase/lipase superfamily enzyme